VPDKHELEIVLQATLNGRGVEIAQLDEKIIMMDEFGVANFVDGVDLTCKTSCDCIVSIGRSSFKIGST
jgi:hypothetical protein